MAFSESSSVEEALLAADKAFCADVSKGGAEAWAAWFARDGVQFPSKGRVDGREAVRKHMEPLFASGSKLLWEPTAAVAAGSGELGYTLGRWVLEDAEGNEAATGNYVTIWLMTADSGWRVAVDIGNSD